MPLKTFVRQHWQCNAFFFLPVCHPQGQARTLWLISRSHTSLNTSARQHPPTTTLPVTTNKARHIAAQYRIISNSPGVAVPTPPAVRVKGYFSLIIFLVDPHLVPTVTSTVQQSVKTMHTVFFLEIGLVWEFIWGRLMFCLGANLDIFRTIQPT